jgi:hypothetical protein
MSEVLPPWVIRKNGAYLGAFGWVGTVRTSAVSFNSEGEASNWSRQNPIARGAEIVNDPYIAPEPQRGPNVSDYEPVG